MAISEIVAVGHGAGLAVDGPFAQCRDLDDAVAVEIHQRHGPRLGEGGMNASTFVFFRLMRM